MTQLKHKFIIEHAAREAAPVTMAIIGQSGSGKTYSALLFARGLVGKDGKIVVIDTEGKRALIYADDPDVDGFEHMNFEMPYSSERYKDAVMTAVLNDANAIIIDSVSHSHEGDGGMIDFAEKEEQRIKGRSAHIQKWVKPKMAHNRFIRAAVGAPAHVIFCIREKVIADMSEEAKRKKPEDKVLYVPVCEKNLIFEMTVAVRLEPDTHKAAFIKVPKPFLTHIKDGEILTIKHGQNLLRVAMTGEELDKEYQKQLTICKDVSAMGMERLQEHWSTLPKEMKTMMKDDLDSKFKPIAIQADSDNQLLEEGNEDAEKNQRNNSKRKNT